jgi:hypothetical protein
VPVTLALSGPELRRCNRRGRAPVRRLLADGAGRFLTKGRYATATSRNGRWLTEDRCASTRIRALRGAVTVRDTVPAKTKTLRRGRAITVSARR